MMRVISRTYEKDLVIWFSTNDINTKKIESLCDVLNKS